MEEIKKMLFAVMNSQSSHKEELLSEIRKAKEELGNEILTVQKNVEKNGKRIDALGNQLAILDDDAPARDEFKSLEVRVKKLEQSLATS
jgi:BMFP domain-containing protein YqiC